MGFRGDAGRRCWCDDVAAARCTVGDGVAPGRSLAGVGRYALIGDTRTGALCGPDGSIDWLCVPRFDGAPVFGALVGGPAAGRFAVGPAGGSRMRGCRYRPRTCTVETSWEVDGGEVTVVDGMVADVAGAALAGLVLVRRVEVRGRAVELTIDFDPRFGWSRSRPRSRRVGGAVVASHGADAVALAVSGGRLVEPGRRTQVAVAPGEPLSMVMTAASREPVVVGDPHESWATLREDEQGWRDWCGDMNLPGVHDEAVLRSLLTLRLLTFSPSGAPVAAPTTSLPEELGGTRDWDYRYAWPRDASMGIAAFLEAGRPDEAHRFLTWLLHASRLDRPRLPVMLTVFGTPVPDEVTLDWPGYEGSRPVRVGNAAGAQHQLDVYGWTLDAAAALVRQTGPVERATWRALAAFADFAAASWHQPDAGLWEVRGEPRHFVHSKLMAWVALDRALRLADSHPTARRRRRCWANARRELAVAIHRSGIDEHRGRYRRAFDDDGLDAALLLLPGTGFEPPVSPRVARTVAAIRRELAAGGPLLYRYAPGTDGVAGAEGAFLACSFWLVRALAELGRRDEAAELLDELVVLGGPLGLYAEEVDTGSGDQLGNYPQALTHAALVQAAFAVATSA